MRRKFRSVLILALISASAMSSVPMMMLIGSIIGVELAPAEQWATLPIAMMVIGTACGVLPATRGMQRFGRKPTLGLFILLGVLACALMGAALIRQSFVLFCLGASLLGATAAAVQQIRFAAMECVPLDEAPIAASIIMASGIIAAVAGPELALAGKHLTSVDYVGSYLLGCGALACSGLLLLLYVPARQAPALAIQSGRVTRELLCDPAILLAIVSGVVAFMVMSFVMTATPIGMHLHHGHSLDDTKWVLQCHIAAMFLPSLFSPFLFRWLSIRGLIFAGLACYCATIAIGLLDVSVSGFWSQLVMLGIGWNFLFVAGTALLPTAYREGEHYRVQALNDSVIFSSQALASLSAGWAISAITWQALLLLCIIPMIVLLGLLLWQRARPGPEALARKGRL